MRLLLLSLFSAFLQTLSAQTFTEAPQSPPFVGTEFSSIAFADVDGDNDPDVLITGRISAGDRISKLYTNDGMGNFTEMMNTPFQGVAESSIAFADVDGDNDPDLLITGRDTSSTPNAKLYTNDGMGNFTEMMNPPFEEVYGGSIAFADVDNDNDQDVLITGFGSSGNRISKLYTNDSLGNFTEVMGTPFEGVDGSSIAFADIDGDNDQDVLVTGFSNVGPIAKLFTNDAAGNFTEMMNTPFEAVEGASMAFADIDGDDDQDVLITGFGNFGPVSKLYTNDAAGNFTEAMGTPFEGVNGGSIAFADIDGDMDQDVLITGSNDSGTRISKLYTNDSLGNFTEMMNTPFEGVNSSSIDFADVDGDMDQDVLITGRNASLNAISKIYINDGMVSSRDLAFELNLDFTLFPNPSTSSRLFYRYESQEIGETTIKVYNINGVLLRQWKEFTGMGQQTFSIDIGSLAKGNYLFELIMEEKRGLSKFTVQ